MVKTTKVQGSASTKKKSILHTFIFFFQFRFGKLIERVYREHLEQKESGDAESKSGLKRTWARALLPFRFVEWDHGDLTLRSHGLAAKFKTSTRLMLEMGVSLRL